MQILDFKHVVSDSRLIARGSTISKALFNSFTCSIQSISKSRAEQKGYYNLLNSPKLSELKMISSLGDCCNANCTGKIVLAISDTSEINLSSHKNRLKPNDGYGDLVNGSLRAGIGFKMHSTIVVDALTLMPLGIGANTFIVRKKYEQRKNYYTKLPIEEKESYKWQTGVKDTREKLTNAKSIIFIQDREGDIYEQLLNSPNDGKSFLLIRSKADRKTTSKSSELLYTQLENSQVHGTYKTIIEGGGNRKSAKQEVEFEVRAISVQFKRPENKPASSGLGKQTPTYSVIETRQVNAGKEDAIVWRLITDWPIETFEQMATVISWYEARWLIEEVFKVLKKEKIDIESCELEDAYAIRKLILIQLEVIIKVFQMRTAYNEPEEGYPASMVFSEDEIKCIEQITEDRLEGKTDKLKNPYKKKTLTYAVWAIARLGGWKGYNSQARPGPSTMVEGLKLFYQIYQGYQLFLKVGTR